MHNVARVIIASGLLFLLGSFAPVAAEPLKKDRVDVFQLKSVTKKRRHELTPLISLSLNDSFIQTMVVGLAYTFHITEGFAFELSGGYAFTFETQTVNDLRNGVDPSQPGKVIKPQFSRVQFYGFGHLVWTPLLGKFKIGKSIVDFDIYLVGGAGYVRTNRDNLVAASFGFGWRVFLTKWLAMRVDVRDAIFGQELLGRSVLTHNLSATLGFGFILPTQPIYTFEQEP